MALDGAPQQREIPHQIQDLVAHELVREPQGLLVHQLVIAHDDRVLKAATLYQAAAPQDLHFLEQRECPCRTDLLLEGLICHVE